MTSVRAVLLRTAWVVGAAVLGTLVGVSFSDATAERAADRMCARVGCPVPTPSRPAVWDDPAAEYVPLCEDTPEGAGPCVMLDDLNGVNVWWYVGQGATYPGGRARIEPCRVETGGPVPCVWVPSAMGTHRNPGDSGAYVYR